MDRYKIVKKGMFQSVKSLEEQLNGLNAEGWKIVSAVSDSGQMYVIMERQR